jgi:signal transduction histidine kinase
MTRRTRNRPDSKNNRRKRIGGVRFSVTARVAMQLGRESISSSITAIIELVKNAYDADAAKVRIRFGGMNTSRPMLIIEDDGLGMRREDIRDLWMVIGTSNKTSLRQTRKGRIVTGEKGLGRLGLDRLCSRTRLQSKRKGTSSAVEVDIDWSLYENSNERLEQIKHNLYSLPNLDIDPLSRRRKRFPHGTRLILEGLKDKWDEASMVALRDELSLMLSPFARAKGFSIWFDSGMAWQTVDGLVPFPKIQLKAARWKVLGRIDEKGRASISMNSHLHSTVFRLRKTPWVQFAKHGDAKPECGALSFEFYYFPRKKAVLAEQTLGRKDIETFLNANQGIRIYRDGFRVKPYGDPSGQGDWLRLAYRKTQNPAAVTRVGDWRLGYNQVIGAVFISRKKNPALQDQTNREGLFQGEGFRDLRVFATKVVEFFEYNNSKFENENAPEPKIDHAQERARAAAEASLQAMNQLSEFVGSTEPSRLKSMRSCTTWLSELKIKLDQTKSLFTSGHAAVEESEEVAQRELDRTKEEKNTMANLASLGILTASFGHETLGASGIAEKNAIWLRAQVTKHAILLPPRLHEEVQLTLDDLLDAAAQIHAFAKFSLDSVSPAKRRRKVFSLTSVVLDVFRAFTESLVIQRNISIKLKVPGLESEIAIEPAASAWESVLKRAETANALKIRAYPSDWESIFVNLITNSIWAMEGTKSKEERHIRIELKSEPHDCVVVFEDSGRGLEAGTEEQIFQPTFSTKRDGSGNIYGTGMGLAIVKSCVEENSGGSIRVTAKGKLGGTAFFLRVPRVSQ